MAGITVTNSVQFLDALKRTVGMVFMVVYGEGNECESLYKTARQHAEVRTGFREVLRIETPDFMSPAQKNAYGLSTGNRGIAVFGWSGKKVAELGIDADEFAISMSFDQAEAS